MLSVLRTWWPLLVATVVLACGASLVISSVSPRIYLGETRLRVGATTDGTLPEYQQILAAQQMADEYQTIATTRPILEAVRERLDLQEDVDELVQLVGASSPGESTFVIITFESLDPEEAAAVVNAVGEELVGRSNGLLEVIQPATPPQSAISPRPLVNAAIAAFVGLLIASALAFAAEYLNERFKSPDDVRATVGLPTLGEIVRMRWDRRRPELYGLATIVFPRSPAAEAYRALRTNVEFASVDAPLHSLLVTSAVPGEGKTLTAANLAVAFAQAGKRVLLVDADFRRPSVDRVFGLPNGRGFTTLFRYDVVTLTTVTQQVDQDNLHVLTTGPTPPNPSELLGSQRMRSMLAEMESLYDLVVVDSPPVRAVTDATILSSLVDGTVLVVDAVVSRHSTVRHSVEALRKANANLLGVVLNRLPARSYSAYHDYHSNEAAPPSDRERAAAVRSSATDATLGATGTGETWRS